MERYSRKKKSAHLEELEQVFEQRARRFSPFEVLGLNKDQTHGKSEVPDGRTGVSTAPLDERQDPGVGTLSPPSPGVNIPTPGDEGKTHGSLEPTPDMGLPTPGVGSPTPVVVVSNIYTTTTEGPTPGVGLEDPPEQNIDKSTVSLKNSSGYVNPSPGFLRHNRPTGGFGKPGGGGSNPPSGSNESTPASTTALKDQKNPTPGSRRPTQFQQEKSPQETLDEDSSITVNSWPVADAVAAIQIGSQLGGKARKVLGYLDTLRSSDHNAYTLPVGYGQISTAVGVDPDHLRRKVLPKLAMLGLIAVARKSLEGTIYHLPYASDYVRVVTSDVQNEGRGKAESPIEEAMAPPVERLSTALPEWIDKASWGWLSSASIQRLTEKAGSEARAKEKLDIIVYNETHGSPEQRVRNRRSVLAHYLASPQAEIWPNDNGFETLEMRQASLERERALREKALAEEALLARQEAARAVFLSSLSEAQLRWVKLEAKRRVDERPASKFLQSRYPLYKAEEDTLVTEWMDRRAYGETVPESAENIPSEPRS